MDRQSFGIVVYKRPGDLLGWRCFGMLEFTKHHARHAGMLGYKSQMTHEHLAKGIDGGGR